MHSIKYRMSASVSIWIAQVKQGLAMYKSTLLGNLIFDSAWYLRT
jgi:hypothetical protein